jgi:hypothetical protein
MAAVQRNIDEVGKDLKKAMDNGDREMEIALRNQLAAFTVHLTKLTPQGKPFVCDRE